MTIVRGSGRGGRMEVLIGGQPLYRKQAVFVCDECGQMSIGETTNTAAVTVSNDVESYLSGPDAVSRWFPQRPLSREFPDVPAHIAGAAEEATMCLSIGAFRAVGALARAVVEATAKEKGITKGRLVEKIDKMAEDGHIRELVKEAAHEVRHFGNDMAHGDFVDEISEEEANEAIELMSEVLEEVFQAPARLARVKAARIAKKAASAAEDSPANAG